MTAYLALKIIQKTRRAEIKYKLESFEKALVYVVAFENYLNE